MLLLTLHTKQAVVSVCHARLALEPSPYSEHQDISRIAKDYLQSSDP